MDRIGAVMLVAAALVSGAPQPSAQELLDATDDELIARERIRSTVESVFDDYFSAPGSARVDAAIKGIERLKPFGEEVVPYLANELERESRGTYDFVAYALGSIRTPGAALALRDAIDRAEATPGDAALVRKAWACWALGLHGELDALERLNSGTHRAAHYSIFANTSVLETIAIQTAPACVPKLIEMYDAWGASENEELRKDRRYVLRALRRVADPATVPKLVEVMRDEPDSSLRGLAAVGLRSLETPESIEALMTGLTDEDPLVRRSASFALEWMMPPGDAVPLLAILDTETDTRTRGALYRVVANRIRPEQLSRFLEQWNQPDSSDRRLLVNALADVESDAISEILGQALRDPNNAVALAAIEPLARSQRPEDTEHLIDALDSSTRWVVVQMIAGTAGRLKLNAFAPGITQRMLEALQIDPTDRPGIRATVDKLGQTLVALQYTSALSKLRRARKSVLDSLTQRSLDATLDQLELLRKNGKSVPKWTALAEDPNPGRRQLAWRRLAELGGDDAVATLLEAFNAAEPPDRIEILNVISDLDRPETRGLVRRVVLDPETTAGERNAAAWVARNYGGPAMFDLLEESVTLRGGRDPEVLVYAAGLGGKAALPLFREFRLSRMALIYHSRGKEQEVLDWIAQQLERDRPIDRYDRSPNKLSFR